MATGRGSTVAPAGVVGFYIGSTSGTSLGTAPVVAACTGTGSAVSCTGTATLSLSGSGLTAGKDSIVAYFEGDGANDGTSTSTAQTLTVYGSPVGNFETAVDQTTGSTTVSSTDSIFISGWAADPVDGSPLNSVVVYIDGASVGSPTLGGSRPDVASAYSNPAYTNSGYQLSYPAGSLSTGSHSITVIGTNKGGVSTTFGPLTINVAVVYPAPVGNLEQAVDSGNGASTIPTSDKLYISGWIADPTDGSPMTNVTVFIDGKSIGAPTLGVSRPDVAAYYNNSAYANSGFNLTYAASSIAPGVHSITVVGINKNSVSTTLGPLSITVTDMPAGNLEEAVDSATGSSTISQSTGTLFVGGWAADYYDKGAAQQVQIFIDGTAVGLATLGGSRPDVASYFSQPTWGTSGYSFTVSASTLSTGTHTVTAVATNKENKSTTLGPQTITVQ